MVCDARAPGKTGAVETSCRPQAWPSERTTREKGSALESERAPPPAARTHLAVAMSERTKSAAFSQEGGAGRARRRRPKAPPEIRDQSAMRLRDQIRL
jgi:hypothetical protein